MLKGHVTCEYCQQSASGQFYTFWSGEVTNRLKGGQIHRGFASTTYITTETTTYGNLKQIKVGLCDTCCDNLRACFLPTLAQQFAVGYFGIWLLILLGTGLIAIFSSATFREIPILMGLPNVNQYVIVSVILGLSLIVPGAALEGIGQEIIRRKRIPKLSNVKLRNLARTFSAKSLNINRLDDDITMEPLLIADRSRTIDGVSVTYFTNAEFEKLKVR